jgi:hypothetical protein
MNHGNLLVLGDAHDHDFMINPGASSGQYVVTDSLSGLSQTASGVSGGINVQTGGHSVVRLVGLTISGDLKVENANLWIDHTTVTGSADLSTYGGLGDWAVLADSRFQGGVHLDAGAGDLYLEGSTFNGDVDVDTAAHGPIMVNLEQDHFFQNLKLEIHDVDPLYFQPDSYRLLMVDVVVVGNTEIHNGATDPGNLAGPTGLLFPVGMDLENVDFLGNLELDVDTAIGTIQFNNVLTESQFTLNVDHDINRFDARSCTFHGGLSVQADHNNALLAQVHLQDTSVDGDAVLKTADYPDQYGPIVPFDPFRHGGSLVELTGCLFRHGLDMTTSKANDTVRLDASDFEQDVTIHLDDGDDTVSAGGCTFAGALHLDGGGGTNGFTDLGGNTFAQGLDLHNISPMTTTTGALSASPGAPRSTAGPWVVSYTPSADNLRVQFSEPIDPYTFTPAQVVLTGDGGVVIPVTAIRVVPGSNYYSLDISFRPTATGGYQAVIGPDIRDFYGNAMDQNRNGINGEATDTFRVGDLQGPRVLWSAPAPGHIRVCFSKAIDPSTFTAADVVLTDLKGGAVAVGSVTPVAFSGNTEFDIGVAHFHADGYWMSVGPAIADCFGNRMDQDQDGTKGQKSDCYTVTYQDTTPPVFQGVSYALASWGITVTFSGPIDPATFTPAAVFIVTQAGRKPVAVSAVQAVPGSEGRAFDIRFPAALDCPYLLSLGSTITDLFGRQLAATGPVSFSIAPPSPPSVVPGPNSSTLRAGGLGGLNPADPTGPLAGLPAAPGVVGSGEPPFTPDQLAQAGTALAADLTASPGTAASLLTGSQQLLASPGGRSTGVPPLA